MFFFSTDYLLFMLPAFVIVFLAQTWVNSTYRRWSRVRNAYGISGADAVQRLIREGGLHDVSLQGTTGVLSDHYDPRSKSLRLSPGTAQGNSVAALAVAAHELGHAVQDHQGYLPLRFRAALVPAVSIGSSLGWILILIGLVWRSAMGTQLAWLGVGIFGLGALFALATLPVELNASSRAKDLLDRSGLIHSEEERRGVNAVLSAAAFTYIAGLAAAILQLLYYASLVAGLGGRRRG